MSRQSGNNTLYLLRGGEDSGNRKGFMVRRPKMKTTMQKILSIFSILFLA